MNVIFHEQKKKKKSLSSQSSKKKQEKVVIFPSTLSIQNFVSLSALITFLLLHSLFTNQTWN